MNSKKIYVVDNGSIVDEGSHTSLISNSEVYKNFYNKQLRKVNVFFIQHSNKFNNNFFSYNFISKNFTK